jgi:hypothetical protein
LTDLPAPRRLFLAKLADVDRKLEDKQRCRVIEEPDSHWSSPVLLVRKKNDDLCFCLDYGKLNDVTK